MQIGFKSVILTQLPLRARYVQTYHLCDILTDFLIHFMLVFSPWAFGTTEPWSIWTMNACGYVLGFLLLMKGAVRSVSGYCPHPHEGLRVEALPRELMSKPGRQSRRQPQVRKEFFSQLVLRRALMLSTCGILAYVLLAALNARATYDADSMTFAYRNYVRWLPASIDGKSTWQTFWNLMALAFCFWATRDWLQAGANRDPQARWFQSLLPSFVSPFCPRLKSLLWVLTISGGLLGLEGIIQRLSGSSKVLFLVIPEFHPEAQEQFASYPYRASAAQYFNLLWPVCLGFWWGSSRSSDSRSVRSHVPLACTAVMAACPIIASARGAAVIDLALLPIATSALLLWPIPGYTDPTQIRRRATVLLLIFFTGALTLGLGLGWKQLLPRLDSLAFGLHERERLYDSARRIAADYPWFGTGPGTFEKVFQLYRGSVDGYWPAQLHNDWLETRVTFGWIGSGMIAMGILIIMLTLLTRVCARRACALDFVLGLSLVGCLLQARWDFPLQVYSILFLFVVWCAVLCGSERQTIEPSHEMGITS